MLRIPVEPTFLALGPYHLAIGMNNRAWFFSLGEDGTNSSVPPELIRDREYLGTVQDLLISDTYASVRYEGRLQLHLVCLLACLYIPMILAFALLFIFLSGFMFLKCQHKGVAKKCYQSTSILQFGKVILYQKVHASHEIFIAYYFIIVHNYHNGNSSSRFKTADLIESC